MEFSPVTQLSPEGEENFTLPSLLERIFFRAREGKRKEKNLRRKFVANHDRMFLSYVAKLTLEVARGLQR